MRSLKALLSCALLLLLLNTSAQSLAAQSKKQKQIKKPRVEVPETWSTSQTERLSSQVAQLKEWWKNFLNLFCQELSIRASAVRLTVRGNQLICPEEQV
jgi:hypothetical protein